MSMADKEIVQTKNITDLCTDCLLTVFRYLDVADLANLVEANITSCERLGKRRRNNKINRFKESIVKAFKIKVSANKWKTPVNIDAGSAPQDIKMLRSFGQDIEELQIIYVRPKKNRRYEKALEDAVSNNCSKTLTSVAFYNCNNESMNDLEQPFLNVTEVEFSNSHVGRTLGQLKKWFPKMKNLKFHDTSVIASKCIHEHFPHLKSLTIWNADRRNGKMTFTNLDLKVFSLMNVQLQSLNIRHDYHYYDFDYDDDMESEESMKISVNWDLLTFINTNLNLKKLTLNLVYSRIGPEWQSTVNIDTLLTLDVECNTSDLGKIKITSAILMDLNLKLVLTRTHDAIDYESIATFAIRAQPKRMKILVGSKMFGIDRMQPQILKIISMLPKLEEVCMEYSWEDCIPDAVIDVLVNGKTLKKLVGVFNFDSDSDGKRCPKYLQMRPKFREKIELNDVVKSKWTFKFEFVDKDCDYYVADSVIFEEKK